MELTAENVNKVLMECLYNTGEDTTGHIIGEGVMKKIGFHPERLSKNKGNIKSLLSQLPVEFHKKNGGGYTFLNACLSVDGKHWGDHPNVDELLMLGLASGLAKYCAPRYIWETMPGGMPYFVIDLEPETVEEEDTHKGIAYPGHEITD